ncbi:response regulator [Spirilliplanes yamanashiensis]|uniref:Response regulator receiver modulated metal-depenent phosphohydrolase n=1 Tax=Spirilliplanes yamanashiensis TaxID=42233 RepID=A0A8J3Y5G5_9ACTN|nr:response regulator [Spirilliplanes yamanashiensis]MDP9819343.1 CheY-like chemotaxis protein [Spirilliplanes yamanashiensis]GIJ01834.1 response regulator receiver modulated metal-depenent phosphohydrolase [Spirilliplanes yamanashiensis]
MADNELFRRAGGPAPDAPAVLVVDDEPEVLETLAHQLREFRTVPAVDGVDALRVLEREGPFAAVVCDMRMPHMDGIELLGEMSLRWPDTVRVLHTAQADVAAAIAAINDGQVFRFVRKPSPTAQLRSIVRQAVERHQQAVVQREVLDKTLKASLQAIFGCLELASPQAFARAGRIRGLVAAVVAELGLGDAWEIEVAAMASQLGTVTLPQGLLQKLDRGLPLTGDEQRMIDGMPGVAVRLLGDVPMLEDVLAIVRGLGSGRAPHGAAPRVAVGVDVLRAAVDVETMEGRGVGTASAIAVLERDGRHDVRVLDALRNVRQLEATQGTIRAYPLAEIVPGMRIVEDVLALNGPVLVGRGVVVTAVLLDRLANYRRMGQLAEPILATVPVP